MQYDNHLKIEQVRSLFKSIKFIVISTFGISLIIVLVLWDAFSRPILLSWLGVATVITLARWWTSRHYKSKNINSNNHDYWLKLYAFFAFLTGLNFGLVPILFFSPDQPVYVLFITCVYTGYMAIGVSSNALYFPAFLTLSIPSSILFISKNLIQGISIYTSIGVTLIFYFIVILYFARNSRDLFERNCHLNYENNKLLKEIIIQKETAEKAVDAKNHFLAAASHDLRQPLHAMGLFIDALKPHVNNEAGQKIVEKISQSKHAINGLLHGLLDISRLDANVVENYPQHVALLPMFESIEEEYKQTALEKDIQFQVNIEPQHIVFIDPVLLERVIRNLIDNAIKYTHQGIVNVISQENDRDIKIMITDTGIGIPDDKKETVFIEFMQLNNPERDRKKGLGLGLSIVKRLCKLMEIKFELQSENEKGTTISLNLPKGKAAKIPKSIGSKDTLIKGLKIVVIDDEKDILEAMQAILCNWGCEVILSLTGDNAIKALLQQDIIPDLIIADFRLGDNENGIDLIERIREEYNQDINAILITGDTAPNRLKLAQTANVMVLHKPVEGKELNAKILSLLHTK